MKGLDPVQLLLMSIHVKKGIGRRRALAVIGTDVTPHHSRLTIHQVAVAATLFSN